MALELIIKAFKTKLKNPVRKLILIKLADNANDQGECWPSHQYIADQCEISRRTVINHINALEECGLLVKEARFSNNGQRSNLYRIFPDQVQVEDDPEYQEGGEGDSPVGVNNLHGGSEGDSQGGSEGDSHRNNHSSEPTNESDILSEGNKKIRPKSKYSEQFERWWSFYRRKEGKGKAWDVWKKNELDDACEFLIERLQEINDADYSMREIDYIPMPATYLNQSRYDDDVMPRAPKGATNETNQNRKLSPHEQVKLANERARAERERAEKDPGIREDLGVYEPGVWRSLDE